MGDRHIPIIDEDKLDDIITALQALSAPSGTDVAISPTGMHIVTEDDVQGAISELDAKAYEINSSLTPNAYSQTGLTTHANVSIVSGGYIEIGKLVIVNIRISISTTISGYSELVKGLPKPLNLNSTNYIAVSTFSGDGAYINSSGNLQNTQQLSSGNNVFSCVYVKE